MTVVITGLGAVTALGTTVAELWPAILAGRTAARAWPDLEAAGYRIAIACRIAEFEANPPQRGEALALAAAREAVDQAGLPPDRRVGVFIGTSMGESQRFEDAAEGGDLDLERAVAAHFPRHVCQALGLTGPARAYGAACAAGNYAIGTAAAAVRDGLLDAAIAGGVEPFSRIAMVGFNRSRAMADDLCRPFDSQRRGMQLGEGAACVVLERLADATARGATPLAAVEALGLSCDAYHPTAPQADGSGMLAAMRDALDSAAVRPQDIGLICAHGTGTPASDAAEARAIAALFPHRPPLFGPKGALGHTLGAAAAVGTVLTALALRHQVAPPTANLVQLDPAFDLDVVVTARSLAGVSYALNCGYGFGGINSALLLRRVED